MDNGHSRRLGRCRLRIAHGQAAPAGSGGARPRSQETRAPRRGAAHSECPSRYRFGFQAPISRQLSRIRRAWGYPSSNGPTPPPVFTAERKIICEVRQSIPGGMDLAGWWGPGDLSDFRCCGTHPTPMRANPPFAALPMYPKHQARGKRTPFRRRRDPLIPNNQGWRIPHRGNSWNGRHPCRKITILIFLVDAAFEGRGIRLPPAMRCGGVREPDRSAYHECDDGAIKASGVRA